MDTARLDTSVVTPARRPRGLQLLPIATLVAGLILGGPSFTEDPSTDLRPMQDWCWINEKGHEMCTGNNTVNGFNGIYIVPAEG